MFFPDPVIKAGAPTGEINITENGLYNVEDYATANVAVPEPTGTINITANGDYNVASYASAHVAVPEPSGNIDINANGVTDVTNYASATVTMIGKTALLEETIEVTPDSNLSAITFNHHLGVIPVYVHIYMKDGFDAAPNSTSVELQAFRLTTQVEDVNFNFSVRKGSGGTRTIDNLSHINRLSNTEIIANWIAGNNYYRAGYTYVCKCFGNIIIGTETDVSQ